MRLIPAPGWLPAVRCRRLVSAQPRLPLPLRVASCMPTCHCRCHTGLLACCAPRSLSASLLGYPRVPAAGAASAVVLQCRVAWCCASPRRVLRVPPADPGPARTLLLLPRRSRVPGPCALGVGLRARAASAWPRCLAAGCCVRPQCRCVYRLCAAARSRTCPGPVQRPVPLRRPGAVRAVCPRRVVCCSRLHRGLLASRVRRCAHACCSAVRPSAGLACVAAGPSPVCWPAVPRSSRAPARR